MFSTQTFGGDDRPVVQSSHSAEYSVSIALFAVCLIVGAAIWWGRPRDVPTPDAAQQQAAVAERAAEVDEAEARAITEWQQRIDDLLSGAGQRRQLRDQQTALDQQAEAARQTEDELRREAAAAVADAEAARIAAQKALDQERLRAAQAAAAPRTTTADPAPAAAALPADQPKSQAGADPIYVDAQIDWNSCRRPEYPNRAMQLRQEGVTTLSFRIDPQGRVLETSVLRSSGFGQLDQAAQRSLGRCRFTPGQRNGEPVESSTTVNFRWQLG